MDVTSLQSIARINAGKDARGTGFVVRVTRGEPGDALELLTALHVVADLEASNPGAPAWRATTAEITLRGRAPFSVPLDAAHWRFDVAEDWALLRVEGPVPADLKPLRLARFEEWPRPRPWTTFGYSDANTIEGTPLSGSVEVVEADTIHLFGKQAGNGGLVSGHSGGPCVFEGHVIGIILSALQNKRRESINGTLYAFPIEHVAAKTGLPLAPSKLVFEEDVAAALQAVTDANLKRLAAELDVPDMDSEPAQRLWIARAILVSEPKRVREALINCVEHVKNPVEVVEMALSRRLAIQGVDAIGTCFADAASRGVATVAQRRYTVDLAVARALRSFRKAARHYQFVETKNPTAEAWSERVRQALLGILQTSPEELDDLGLTIEDQLADHGSVLLAFPFDPVARPLDAVEHYPGVRALPMLTAEGAAGFARDGYRVAAAAADAADETALARERSAAAQYLSTKR